MPNSIDETELARLEELATHYARVVTPDNVSIPHQIINAVPALIAEVRRLREALNKEHRAWQCAEGRGDGLEMENAALREKVEALVKEKLHLKAMTFALAEQHGDGNLGRIQNALDWADAKARKREAVHADRE